MKIYTKMLSLVVLTVVVLFSNSPVYATPDVKVDTKPVPTSPQAVQPLLVGQKFPAVILKNADGADVDLSVLQADKPSVLVFYRGGWCKYCTEQLVQLQSFTPEFDKLGFQLIAISPDTPENLKITAEKFKLNLRLLSDSNVNLIGKLGIAFQLDDATVKKYKNEYKVDLEGASGQKHHQIPVPSTFVVDREGLIHFSYVNPNYKVRINPEVLLAVSRSVLRQEAEAKQAAAAKASEIKK